MPAMPDWPHSMDDKSGSQPIALRQLCIAGQAVLRGLGVGRIPVVNVENACATASTAFQQAATMITLGGYDVVLAFGMDKLYHPDKRRVFSVFEGCADVEQPQVLESFLLQDGPRLEGAGQTRSVFMDIYARLAREYMAASGATAADFAAVSAKNSVHGNLNPNSQFQSVVSVQEVLDSAPIVAPLTLMMCSPIADGAADDRGGWPIKLTRICSLMNFGQLAIFVEHLGSREDLGDDSAQNSPTSPNPPPYDAPRHARASRNTQVLPPA